jgi:sugar phosphate isomerase/epimerase
MNRRSFITTMAAGIGWCRASRANAAPKARFELGIGTYTYRGVSLEQMVEDLKALSIRQVEVSLPDYFLPKVKPETVPSLRTKLENAGIKPVSYFCGDIKSQADLDLTVQVTQALGANHVSGAAVGETLKMIDARFTRERLKFGIHNHFFHGRKFEYESPEDVLRALAGVSETIGATLDTGHMASCGYDPVEAIVKLWPRLQMVHLKDVASAGDDKDVVLGRGVAKSAEVIRTLVERGFRDLVAIEYEANPEDPQPDVARCVEFARKLM